MQNAELRMKNDRSPLCCGLAAQYAQIGRLKMQQGGCGIRAGGGFRPHRCAILCAERRNFSAPRAYYQ
jgi:hypothetical protein